jgi:hypothetical protein
MDALSPDNLDAFVKAALDAVNSKNYPLLAALGVVLAVWILRKYGGEKFPVLRTDRGGASLALLTSAAGAVVTALLSGTPFTWPLAGKALVTAFLAVGGFSLVKKLVTGDADKAKADAKAAGEKAAAVAPVPSPMDIVNGGKK